MTEAEALAAGFTVDDRYAPPPQSRMAVLKQAVTAVPQLVVLLYRLLRDARVPRRAKLIASGIAAYVAVPIDVVPEVVPVIGHIDDVVLLSFAVHTLLKSVDDEVRIEYWDGSPDALAVVEGMVGFGAEFIPKKIRWWVT